MDKRHKKFMEMVANTKIDHDVICGLLDDIAQSTYEDALKRVTILKQLLINHFFVEDFILYPYIRDRYITKQSVNRASLFDIYEIDDGHDDMVRLTRTMSDHDFAGEKFIGMVSECVHSKKEDFEDCFKILSDCLKERITFEDNVLEKRTSPRIHVNVRIALEIKGKRMLTGTMKDISETGCFFEMGGQKSGLSIGEVGYLHMFQMDTIKNMPCKIVRIAKDGLAVQFLDSFPEASINQLSSYMMPFGQ